MAATRHSALTAISLSVLALGALLTACDEGQILQPPGAQFSVTLTGALLDGRDLERRPLAGTVALFQSDKTTPVTLDGDNVIEVGANGTFQASFEAFLTDPILVLTATAPAPFLPVSKAVRVGSGPVDAELYLSGTVLSGHVEGPDGMPAEVDIWVMRDDAGSGDFTPYAIAGGRDFIPPVPPSGIEFGFDTDALGDFAIPVRVPEADFRLVFVVDRNTDKFASFLTDLFVTSGQDNRVVDIRLEAAAPAGSVAR